MCITDFDGDIVASRWNGDSLQMELVAHKRGKRVHRWRARDIRFSIIDNPIGRGDYRLNQRKRFPSFTFLNGLKKTTFKIEMNLDEWGRCTLKAQDIARYAGLPHNFA